MKTLCILIATALFCSSTPARLGETMDEISKRYGRPSRSSLGKIDPKSGLPQKNYSFKGYRITVVFKDGKCVREWVFLLSDLPLTDDECFELVKGITGDTNLIRGKFSSWEGEGWWASGGGMLLVTAQSYNDQVEQHARELAKKEKESAKKNAQGF